MSVLSYKMFHILSERNKESQYRFLGRSLTRLLSMNMTKSKVDFVKELNFRNLNDIILQIVEDFSPKDIDNCKRVSHFWNSWFKQEVYGCEKGNIIVMIM